MHNEYGPVMRPNAKELARASGGYTVVVRPNRKKGGWNVAVIEVESCKPFNKVRHVEDKSQIAKEIASDLRMLDKMGSPSPMADASRMRMGKSR